MNTAKMSVIALSIAALAGCAAPGERIIAQAQQAEKQTQQRLERNQVLMAQRSADEIGWWQQLHSDELNQLVDSVLVRNQDLQAASARIKAALANLDVSEFAYWPNGGLNAQAQRGKNVQTASSGVQEQVSAHGVLNWQLDLSGRLRALADAASARSHAQLAAHQQLSKELVVTTVRSYMRWQGFAQQQQLTERQLEALSQSMDILAVQVEEGVATEFELNRTRSQYFQLKQRLPQLQALMLAERATLAMILDSSAQQLQLTALSEAQYQQWTLNLALLDPQQALMQRPDVRRSVAQLTEQAALSTSAQRALYPDVSLSAFAGVLGVGGSHFQQTQGQWQVTPQVQWSLFSYPELLAQLRQQKALSQAQYHSYRQTLSNVIAGAELSLQTVFQQQQTLNLAQSRLQASQQAYEQARAAYEEGQLPYLELLDARQDVLIAQQDTLITRDTWLNAQVGVYSELSGRWSRALHKVPVI